MSASGTPATGLHGGEEPGAGAERRALISLRGLTKRFGGVTAIDGVTATLAAEPVSAVIGANGAGKTTLFRLIAGVYMPTAGTIEFDGADLGRLSPSARVRRGIAHTSQGVRLFPSMSVLENVWVGLRSGAAGRRLSLLSRRERARQQDEAAAYLARVSPALLKRVNDPAGQLPYGEQRRVEIARTLAAKPRLLLLDEPAAGLTRRERAELTDLVSALTADGTLRIVLIEHDVSLVMQVARHITVLDMGRFLGEGTPAEIRQDPRVLAAYLGSVEPGQGTRVTVSATPPTAPQAGPPGTAPSGTSSPGEAPASPPLLMVRDASVSYGRVAAVVNISFSVAAGQIFALLGANGAGKSSTINMISGLKAPASGSVELAGAGVISRRKPHDIVRLGISQVPEGRRILPKLTVHENLEVAGYLRRREHSLAAQCDRIYETFPELARMRGRMGGALSGGEQQMLAIGRALMSDPKVLMLDEPSLGLAPMLVDRIWAILQSLRGQLTVILVEQNYARALEIADVAAVLNHGSIERQGPADVLAQDSSLSDLYLGGGVMSSDPAPGH
jgi:branched-chain amino acid transport system ATP-binding protein